MVIAAIPAGARSRCMMEDAMTEDAMNAKAKADQLHDEEEREIEIAASLPDGESKDEHQMKGERLSDKAWAIEEANDIPFRPSGLWPEA